MSEFVVVIALTPALVIAAYTFGRLLRIEFEKYNNQWVKDGKPCCYWRPLKNYDFQNGFAAQRLFFFCLFRTPEWIKNDKQAMKLLRITRVSVLMWNIGIAAIIGVHLFFR